MTVKKESVWRLVISCILVLLVWIGFAWKFDFYYDLNDDTFIRDIVSGVYTGTPSGYCIQMLYPLNIWIALCYKAIPGVAWYGLFLCLCQFGCLGLVLYHTSKLPQKKWMQAVLSALLLFLMTGGLARQWVILQYTVTSGILMATAIYLFVIREQKVPVLPIVLVVLSFCIRTEMCLMLFPFLLLTGLIKWYREEQPFHKENVKKYLITIGSALLCMGLLWGVDRLAYSWNAQSQQWQEYRAFFDARTKLYDFYGIPDYEQNQDFYTSISLSREQYELLVNYNFALDETIDAKLLNQIAEYQKKQLHPILGVLYTKHTLKEGLWLYKRQLLTLANRIGSIAVLLCYFLYFFQSVRLGKRRNLWNILGLAFIRSALWIYLLLVDRLLPRVTIPLILTEIAVLLGWILLDWKTTGKALKELQFLQYGMLLVLLLTGLSMLEQNVPTLKTEFASREAILPRYQAYLDYCKEHDKKYFVLDVFSSTSYDGVAYSEKIFRKVDNSYRNQDICGGWLTKSPLTKEKQMQYDIDSLSEGLLTQKAYFVVTAGKDVSWMRSFYASKGVEVELQEIDQIMLQGKEVFQVYEIK